MGVSTSTLKGYIAHGHSCPDVVRCYPSQTLTKFPRKKGKKQGELIEILQILPKYSVENPTIDVWWTFCQFFPNNDNIIISTSTPFQILHGIQWKKVSSLPCGKVMQYNLDNGKSGVIPQASCKGFPKLQINPDGRKLTTLDTSSIHEHLVVYNPGHPIIHRARDSHFTQYRDYATSANGRYHAVVAKATSNVYTLSVYGSETVLVPDAVMKIPDLYPDIKPPPLPFTDRADVKWSPDSRLVAVGFSKGELIVVDWKKGQGVCSVFEEILSDCDLQSPSTYDFDPRSQHCVMAVAANDTVLYIINTEKKKMLCSSSDLGSCVDCLKYSYDSNCIVSALFNLKIKVLDADDLNLQLEIDLTVVCPDFEDILLKLGSIAPNTTCLSLSSTGEQAAIACWDRKIRVMQLLNVLNLQSLCKFAIQRFVHPSDIEKLPLPHLLKDYLYSFPFNP